MNVREDQAGREDEYVKLHRGCQPQDQGNPIQLCVQWSVSAAGVGLRPQEFISQNASSWRDWYAGTAIG